MYQPVGITAGTSSFDLAPSADLDPNLFDGSHLQSRVRFTLLGAVRAHLDARYKGADQWLRAWFAGSGASYRWHASAIKDLDVLLGVHFVQFRQANPGFAQMGDVEISHHLNEELRTSLWPTMSNWQGEYEVTFYINPRSWDIRAIHPYAAYDLIEDGWTVPPTPDAPTVPDDWSLYADIYRARAQTAVERYSQSLTDLQGAQNPAHRRDAELRFKMSVDQAVSLFDVVHSGRTTAFAPTGKGYDDFSNYLWQSGKKVGWIPALRQIKNYHQQALASSQRSTYGVELPTSDLLIRRAALQHR